MLDVKQASPFRLEQIVSEISEVHEVPERTIQRALSQLRTDGYLGVTTGEDDVSREVYITPEGEEFLREESDLVYELYEEFERTGDIRFENATGQLGPQIPATDRIVTLDDNQRSAVTNAVGELKSAVIENRDNTFDDKEFRLAEIAALESLLTSPQVNVDLVQKLLDGTVTYLAKKFAENAIGIAANAVLIAAAKVFGGGIF